MSPRSCRVGATCGCVGNASDEWGRGERSRSQSYPRLWEHSRKAASAQWRGQRSRTAAVRGFRQTREQRLEGRDPLPQHVLVHRPARGLKLSRGVGQRQSNRLGLLAPRDVFGGGRRTGRAACARVVLLGFDGFALPPACHGNQHNSPPVAAAVARAVVAYGMREIAAVRRIQGDEAAALLAAGNLTVLDVRTPSEHVRLGHLPGSRLLPVDLVLSAPAVLPDDGRPLLVYCEHGVRSAHAAQVLAAAGFGPVYDLAGGMAEWRGPRQFGATPIEGPAGWLLDNGDLLRPGMRVLDVAAGRGRHALLLAGAGLAVTAIDRDAAKMARLADLADRLGLALTTEVRDLESGDAALPEAGYDLVVVTNYLHRPLMPARS